jgi:hypothetical protein
MMRTSFGIAVVVMVSVAMWAQMPVGGTFSNVQAQPVQYGTPIMSPPTVTLGNGLTPTVITNRQPFVVGAPQFLRTEPVTAPVNAQPAESDNEQPATPGGQQQRQARKRFDFVISSGGAQSGRAANDSRSLVEVAAATRKAHITPISGKVFTNDDVARMNQKYGMRPQPSTAPNPGPGNASTEGGMSGTAVQAGTEEQTAPGQNQQPPAYANPPKR